MLVKLFVIAAAALACATSVSSSTADVQLYQDSSCSSPIGEPLSLDLPFSPQCQSINSNPPISTIFNCVPDGKNTNFTLQLYNGTADCTGELAVGIVSDDTTGGCAKTTISAQGQSFNAYSHITCTAAKASARPMTIEARDEAIEDVIDFVSAAMRGGEFKTTKYNPDGTVRPRASAKLASNLHKHKKH